MAGASDWIGFPLASSWTSSPFTDPEALAFLEAALDREAGVFLSLSLPSAARFARRFSLDADGGMVGQCVQKWTVTGRYGKKGKKRKSNS